MSDSPNTEKKGGLAQLAKSGSKRPYAQIRDPREYATKDEREAEEDFLAPARWWFVSTFFPLVAGTFGPVATMFSICAITEVR